MQNLSSDNHFFREVTLAICSSLDIEISLHKCLKIISQRIPVDMVYLNFFNPTANTLHFIAKASRLRGDKISQSIEMPHSAKELVASENDIVIMNCASEDSMGRFKTQEIGSCSHSSVIMPLAIEGHHLGVVDFTVKGDNQYTQEHAALLSLLREPFSFAMSHTIRHEKLFELKEQLADDYRNLNEDLLQTVGNQVIGSDKGLKGVMELITQVSPLNSTVLLQGETGVGKDVIANMIHMTSQRESGPFIRVNCGAIPETLVDSELFGHDKGAFTGAVAEKRGRFERANGGTIFLDEIGELSASVQVRLLRVLQNREIERVGGKNTIEVDIRVICATHQDLKALVEQGKFREDLWYRINAFPVLIPPLRHRREDIPDLARFLIDRKSKEMGIFPLPRLHSDAISQLSAYEWPGNIRELENEIERGLIKNRSGTLSFQHLIHSRQDDVDIKGEGMDSLHTPLDDVIRQHISNVVEFTQGCVEGPNGAATILKTHPNTLRKKMQKLGIAYGRSYKRYHG